MSKTQPSQVDSIVLMLVSGISPAQAERACTEKLGMGEPQAKRAIAAARRQITIAADYDRIAEIGTAYTRLNDLYSRSLKVSDVKVALAAQKELHRLLALYEHDSAGAGGQSQPAGDDSDNPDIAAIADHLLPLQLAPATYPIAEHARLAADFIRRHREAK